MAECSVKDGQNTKTIADESKRPDSESLINHHEIQPTGVVRRRSLSSNGDQNG